MKLLKKIFAARLLVPFLILNFVFASAAQSPKAETEKPKTGAQNAWQDFELDSKLTTRKMPYRVILPADYNASNEKTFYPVVYLLHGLTGHFGNWADKTKLADYAKNYRYIFVMPEGDNGWYTDSATAANDKYESYIVRELIPEIERKFRASKTRDGRAIAGLSMGGYGAVKFGFKYPQMFALVGSFSGALGAASWDEKAVGTKGTIAETLLSVFGSSDNANRPANDIFKMAADATAEQKKSFPFIYQSCGTEDFLYKNNRDFVDLLQEKKIPHEFRETPGGHEWNFWNTQIKEFLEASEQFLK